MKIFYYTATGNSLQVAKAFEGELHSIPRLNREKERSYKDDAIGFVFPCYVGSIPTVVEEFIEKNSFDAKYIFAIITYGNIAFGATKHVFEIGKKHGLNFSYINQIKMVDTSLKHYEMKRQKSGLAKKKVDYQIEQIKKEINLGARNSGLGPSFIGKLSQLGYNSYRKEIGDCDQKFTVESHCTQCKVCEQVCPVNNIELNETVGFSGNCIRCYACTQNCPQNAIRFDGEKSKERYRNSQVSLKEIIESNN